MTDTCIYYIILTDMDRRGRWRYIIRENGQREIYASQWRYKSEPAAWYAGLNKRNELEQSTEGNND